MKAAELKRYIKKLVKEAVREELKNLLEEDIKRQNTDTYSTQVVETASSIQQQLGGFGRPKPVQPVDPRNPLAAAFAETAANMTRAEMLRFAAGEDAPVQAPGLTMEYSHAPQIPVPQQQTGPVMMEEMHIPQRPGPIPGFTGIDFGAKLKAMEEAQKRRSGGGF